METMETSHIIYNAISNHINHINNNTHPQMYPLYRGLHLFEEQDAYDIMLNEPDNTIGLFYEKYNNNYYFAKINGQIYHVITNDNNTCVYCVCILEYNR